MKATGRFRTPEEVFAWMEKTCTHAFQPGLERMEWVLRRVDHPERRSKFIHIAGTNGKGSTAAMISSILREAGYSTGLFISPYLTHWSERIQSDGEPISGSSFVKWANDLRSPIEEMVKHGPGAPSSFEYWALLALCYFAFDVCPWFVVWETGLGGRLDATNVVYPFVSVITQIGLDHQEQLGQSPLRIASEKAGIIKPGVPVVCGVEEVATLQVIQEEAEKKKSSLYALGRDFKVESVETSQDSQSFHFSDVYRTVSHLEIPLIGQHQLNNAATALMTLEVLQQSYATQLDLEQIGRGLKKVRWPGRLEKLSTKPLILLDGAHNRDGMEALASTLKQYTTYRRLILLLAMMKEKDVTEIVHPLLSLADLILVTEVRNQPRSLSAEELAHQVKEVDYLFASAEEAVRWAQNEANEEDLILITGSLYLLTEIRPLLIRDQDE